MESTVEARAGGISVVQEGIASRLDNLVFLSRAEGRDSFVLLDF